MTDARREDPTLGKPVAGAPGAPPLHLPDVPFPPYRFVPGKAPHPFAHEGGYLHGQPRPEPPHVPSERWRESQAYLRGIDFFNRGWWWEAHEAWEDLWHVVASVDPPQHALLQGLIQLAACALNRERASDRGAARLLETACGFLEQAESGATDGVLCGLHLPSLREAARRHLGQPADEVTGFYLVPG